MDDQLKGLKENMDDTVLKNLDFRERNKAAVRNAISNPQKSKRIINLFPRVLSIAITCIFIIGVSSFGLQNLGLIQKEEQRSGADDKKEIQTNNNNIYTPPQQEENYDDMAKEEVVTKLLNTVDYFHSVSGKFEQFDKYKDRSTSKIIVDYQISLKNVMGGYEKIINIPDEKIPGANTGTDEIFYNDQTIWHLENDRKTYFTNDYVIEPRRAMVKPENVFSIAINKIYDSEKQFRERPPSGVSGISLFPYESAAKYLRFTNLWDIEKQNEELLGHNTVVLSGTIDESIINFMQPDEKSFRFWVDKDTGILVKYEIYNIHGELISYLHPESLSVNVPIDSTQFIPDLEPYNKMEKSVPFYEDSREKDIEVIEHADTIKEDVEAVLDTLRSKVPSMYEFSHPKLQIFSASMEKYQQFNQAYLTYSYKKGKDEPGSGSRLIYLRTYHKDSAVRSTGDFPTEKGEVLDTITIDGIKWELYEVKNTSNAHFIGSSGDYKYEIVGQDISVEETKALLDSFIKSAP
ncbi:hypothetical protein V7111_10020 [Neobacillus niacini]|uniref:hypothetical protein n=1 Tax=Neobacillus niacini TaxID=86668 RepID=UPI003000F824